MARQPARHPRLGAVSHGDASKRGLRYLGQAVVRGLLVLQQSIVHKECVERLRDRQQVAIFWLLADVTVLLARRAMVSRSFYVLIWR